MDFTKQPNITIFKHPLIKHKISLLRDKEASTNKFRTLIEEIAMLEAYEALSDLPLKEVEVETPLEKCKTPMLDGLKLAIIPVLRAGLGMVDGMLQMVPNAKVGHIGVYRDPVTHKPIDYYCKLPCDIDKRQVFVVDPMLATGGSAAAAIDFIKERGGKKIIYMCIIAAPEGIEVLQNAHPDVDIFIAAKDRELNEHAYIVPGLGDAGDRLFGTK